MVIQQQNEAYQRQLDAADEAIKRGEEHDRRYAALLDKWEQQARRFDLILDRWERLLPPPSDDKPGAEADK
ncbi:MAG TPA: hypothetical protein PKK06_01740 [Phycisphaerae bacterium]|nr:hypothetical protein [Phycisphaerae bacterium]HNU44154.1 hypothetical protein [Phycisphaerae bacterium]